MQDNVGIYRYINTINGKSYVGQSLDLKHRHNEHINLLKRGVDGCTLLQKAWNKYGEENFVYEIICLCKPEELDALEIRYIELFDSYRNGYNCNEGGAGNSGFNHSEITKRKISVASKGRKFAQETLRKMSLAQQGRNISAAHRKALSDAWTAERKRNLSETRSGVNNPNYGKCGKDSCNAVPIVSNSGNFFFTAVDAAKWCGLKSATNISSCINGKRKSAGRHPITNKPLIWRKATLEEIQLYT